MSKIKLIFSALFMIIGALVIGLVAYNITPPPTVAGSNVSTSLKKIGSNAPVKITFSTWMDTGSSQEAFSIEPDVEGDFSWDGNTMLFTPKEDFPIGSSYIVSIADTAKSTLGKKLQSPFQVAFVITSPPEVSFVSPQDITVYKDTQPITVMFSQPMVSLQALTENKAHGVQLEIDPKTEGRIEWIDTHTMQFQPTHLLDASEYTVTIKKGSTAADGGEITEDLAFSFDTPAPQIVSTSPNSSYSFGPPTPMEILFNTAIRPEELEKNLIIDPAQDFSARFSKEDNHKLIIEPKGSWDFDTEYTFTLPAGLNPAEGTKTLEEEYTWSLKTVGSPALINTDPSENETEATIYGLRLDFNTTLQQDALVNNISISPEVELDISHNETDSVYIDGTFEYSTEYTVTVKQGVKDIFNQTLSEDYTFSFTTQDRPKSISIDKTDYFSLFSAYDSPVYPVKSVNIGRYEVFFCKMSVSDFLNNDNLYSQNRPNCEESKTWEQTVKSEKNALNLSYVEFEKRLGNPLSPGVYFIEVTTPDIVDDSWRKQDQAYFFLTKTALSMKKDGEQTLVWATDLKTGAPVPDMNVTFYNEGVEKNSGVTNTDGLYVTEYNNTNSLYILGTKGDDISLASSYWSDGIATWDFGLDSDYESAPFVGYTYTDRPIYRPGHEVHFKGYVRKDRDASYSLPPENSTVEVIIDDAQYREIYKETLTVSSNGTFDGILTLSDEASLGQYRISWRINDEYLRNGGYRSFYVEEYKKPEFLISLSTPKDDLVSGDDFRSSVEATYYFGGPLNNAEAEWTLKKSNYFFSEYDGPGWFNFSADEEFEWCYWGGCDADQEIVSEGTVTLDAQGKADITVPLQTKDDTNSKLYTLEVTIQDKNQQSVSGRTTLPWHKGDFYIGMKSQSYVVAEGEEATFDIITVDTDGQLTGNKSMNVEFLKREWKSVKKKDVDGLYYWESAYEDTAVGSKSLSTDNEGKGTVSFIPPSGGYFIARATGKDGRGNEVGSMSGTYASSSDYVSWGRNNTNRIDLVTDKVEYSVGDTAQILIPSPFENAKALVTYERGLMFHYEIIDITSTAQTLEVPVTEAFLPNTYISVFLIKQGDSTITDEESGFSQTKPEFRMGYATIKVDTSKKELDISLTPNKDTYLPGEEVTLSIETKDSAGNPVDAELVIGVVDASVLALKGNPKENLLEAFYFDRGLGVLTASNLSIFTETINVQAGSAKGGGGGDEGLEKKDRGEFKDTAYWNPTLQTTNGKASVTFTLPDNLTTWHAVALGVSNESLAGNTDTEFMATKNLLLRPVTPRFVRFNDRLEIGAIIHNFTKESQIVNLEIEIDNAELKNNGKKSSISLGAGEEQLLTWNIQVQGNEQLLKDRLTMTMTVENDNLRDSVTNTIPILQYASPETVASFGETSDIVNEFIDIPAIAHGNLGSLEVTLTNALVTSLDEGISYLIEYPYGCAEQITSRLLSMAAVKGAYDLSQIYLESDTSTEKAKLTDKMESLIQSGLPKIYAMQRGDGGFGYWVGSSETSPYLSAYVLYGLSVIKEAGFAVDNDVINNGKNYMTGFINRMGDELNMPEGFEDYRYSPTTQAFMIYALSQHGEQMLSRANVLFENREKLTSEGKAHLALTFGTQAPDKVQTLLNELTANAMQDAQARYTHFSNGETNKWMMDSDIRTTAIVLRAFIELDPENPIIAKSIRYLQEQKVRGHWATTQETVHTLLSLSKYLEKIQKTPGTYVAKVALNNEEKLSSSLSPENTDAEVVMAITELLKGDNTRNELSISKEGEGQLFYEMVLTTYLPLIDTAPKNHGFSIKREYFELSDEEEANPITYTDLGETLKGKITIVVPDDRYQVAVESHLPAGFEGVNLALDTTEQRLAEYIDEPDQDPWYWYPQDFTHTEIRDDRIVLFADHLPAGVYEYEYLVNVTSSGIFAHPPAMVYEMYYPEVSGHSKGELINVKK